MDAREIESLSMLQRGFAELKEANPELTYKIVLDMLQGINESGIVLNLNLGHCSYPCSNPTLMQHVQTSRGLFPHRRIIRKSEMTSKGLIVTEEQEVISGLPPSSDSLPPASQTQDTSRKSPIAELLYLRWLEGLKLKWPSIMS